MENKKKLKELKAKIRVGFQFCQCFCNFRGTGLKTDSKTPKIEKSTQNRYRSQETQLPTFTAFPDSSQEPKIIHFSFSPLPLPHQHSLLQLTHAGVQISDKPSKVTVLLDTWQCDSTITEQVTSDLKLKLLCRHAQSVQDIQGS